MNTVLGSGDGWFWSPDFRQASQQVWPSSATVLQTPGLRHSFFCIENRDFCISARAHSFPSVPPARGMHFGMWLSFPGRPGDRRGMAEGRSLLRRRILVTEILRRGDVERFALVLAALAAAGGHERCAASASAAALHARMGPRPHGAFLPPSPAARRRVRAAAGLK